MEAGSILGCVNRSIASRLREVGFFSSLYVAFSFATVTSLGLKMLINLHKFNGELPRWLSDVGHRTCEERLSKKSLFSLAKWPLGVEMGLNSSLLVLKRRRLLQVLD